MTETYNIILGLRPYFFSLRNLFLKTPILSLDIKIPASWSYLSIVKSYESEIPQISEQDKTKDFILLSLMTTNINENGLHALFKCAYEIITFNKDEEEKQKLLNEKIEELKELFKSASLSQLKNVKLLENGNTDADTIGQRIEMATE